MENSNLRLSAVISADVSQFTAAFRRITQATKEAGGKIAASTKQFSAKVSASFKEMSSKMKAAGDKMESVGKNLSLKVSLPIAALGTSAVMSAVKFEVLQKSLDVLTGSAEKGAEAFNKIKAFSAATPFQLDDLVQVNNMLIGFGLTADDSFEALKQLSDISAVTGADLSRMSVAFGQSAGMGRVMTQDLNQFVNNGVPIYKLLTDVTGKSTSELRDMAADGELTFDILEAGIKKATSAGGLFFEGTEQLSKTLGGRLSTLRDNFNLMMASFGDVMGEVIKPLTILLTETFKGLGNMSDGTKRWVVATAALAAAIGPIVVALGFMVGTLFPLFLSGIASIGTALAFLVTPVGILAVALTGLAFIFLKAKADSILFQVAMNEAFSGTLSLETATKNLTTALDELATARKNGASEKEIKNLRLTAKLRLEDARAVYERIKAGKELAIQAQNDRIASLESMNASPEAIEITKTLTGVISLYEEQLKKASESIKTIEARISSMGESFEDLNDGTEDGTTKMAEYAISLADARAAVNGMEVNSLGRLAPSKEQTENMKEFFGSMDKGLKVLIDDKAAEHAAESIATLTEGIGKMNESVTSAINLVQGGLTGAFTQFFTTLSNGGENPFQSIIDFLKRLVIRLLAAAAAAFVLAGILSALGFGAMAGTSFQALFVGMTGLNIGGGGADAPNLALANGGIVSGPTNALIGEYAGAGTNPEVVAPLNKLKSMIGVGSGETIIKGSDLLVIMKRAMQEEGRI